MLGHRHPAVQGELHADAPVAEIRHRDDGAPADPQEVFEHDPRLPRRLQGLRQDHEIEGVVGIIGEIGVGVALNDREALGHAVVDALLRQLDAPPVDVALFGEQAKQLAVAAADVEHARPRRDHLRTRSEVDAAGVEHPREASFQPPRPRRGVNEAPRRREQFRHVEQEGVVPPVGLDLDERDGGARRR